MDSITQAALGAAVAHATWHRSLGRWSLAWGVVLGTLPDLDVLAFPFLDSVEELYWHRGESHAIWSWFLGALLLGPLIRTTHRRFTPQRPPLTFPSAFLGVWLILATHVLIDFFTIYGTQLLAPFSRHGFGTGNLFIIDPLYTFPLVLGILLAAALRTPRARQLANLAGLALSTFYVAWSFAAQARAAHVFSRELSRQNITLTAPDRTLTSASALNTLLWRHLAEVEGGFVVGYWSLVDPDTSVRFHFIPRNAGLVAPVRDTRAFECVQWFSQGFWRAQLASDGSVHVADLRFNEIRPSANTAPERWGFPFTWTFPSSLPVDLAPETIPLRQVPPAAAYADADLSLLWSRLRGDRSDW